MIAEHLTSSALPLDSGLSWIAEHHGDGCAKAFGFREAAGGVHLSKTMMLAELSAVMDAVSAGKSPNGAVLSDNVLGKATGAARRLALSRLNTLYGIMTPLPLQAAALRLWPRSIGTAIKRQHEPVRIVGDLLTAEISEKQARSIRYQISIAKLPLAKDVDDFTFGGTPINETLVRDLAAG